jgi:diguanylate cyclase (GGDEF)-like protein
VTTDGLRVYWVPLGTRGEPVGGAEAPRAPAVPGVAWQFLEPGCGLNDSFTAVPSTAAVIVVTGEPGDAVSPLTLAELALQACPVLVLVLRENPSADAALYAAGVQDVISWEQLDATLPRRIAAAAARKQVQDAGRVAYATDPDTGLVNRQQLVEHLSHLLAIRAREPAPIGLVVLQVGRGQVLQGSLGHEQLALVRRKIGVRLRSGVRASDVVASIGPDAFAVMLSSIDTPADTRTVATKLAVALRHPFVLGGEAVTVPVEVGYAVAPEDGDQPEALLRRAVQRITSTAFNPRQAANDP